MDDEPTVMTGMDPDTAYMRGLQDGLVQGLGRAAEISKIAHELLDGLDDIREADGWAPSDIWLSDVARRLAEVDVQEGQL